MKKIIHSDQRKVLFLCILVCGFGLQSSAAELNSISGTATQTSVNQQVIISGNVIDASTNEAVIGANIIIEGTNNGTITDINGKFSIKSSTENPVLLISFLGYESEKVETKGAKELSISLQPEAKNLDEVVVVGYGTMKRSSVTGASTTIKSDKLKSFPVANIADALQGKAAGLMVSPATMSGEASSIRIRGTRSFYADSEPLVIIDGMPGSLKDINSNDIESAEVLKDAAATSIYGSRAANGVILVTTKSGKKGDKTRVEINTYFGQDQFDMVKMQTPDEYANMLRDVRRYATYGVDDITEWQNSTITAQSELNTNFHTYGWDSAYSQRKFFDWQSAIYAKTAPTQGHQINITGGSGKTTFRISYGYQDDKSYYKNSDFAKNTFSSNINHEINKWVSADVAVRYRRIDYDKYPSNMWENIKRMTPFESPYDPTTGLLKEKIGREQYINALYTYEPGNHIDKNIEKSLEMIAGLKVKPFKFMTFSTNFKWTDGTGQRNQYFDKYSISRNFGNSFASKRDSLSTSWTWNNILSLDHNFGKHHLNATFVHEAISFSAETTRAKSEALPTKINSFNNLAIGTLNILAESGYTANTLLSFMGRFQYEYDNKYIFNVSVRRDGSSMLAEGHQWASFPAVSVAWRASEEGFIKELEFISNLKFRASYGVNGQQAIQPYQTLNTLTNNNYSWNNVGFYTKIPTGIANKALSWEMSTTKNIGLDFGLFNDRISGTIEVYQTLTSDLLFKRPLPATAMYKEILQNVAETENKGIEVTLSGSPIRTKNFSWNLTATFTRNYNQIIDLIGGQDLLASSLLIGQPMSVYYDYKMLGIWQMDEAAEAATYLKTPGEIKNLDVNGDFRYTSADYQVLGQRDPKYFTSLMSSMNIYDFDFSFTIMAQGGNIIRPQRYADVEYNGEKWIVSGVKYWTPLNPTNEFPRAQTSQGHNEASGLGFMDGSFAKVQDITFGYSLPKTVSKALHIENWRVYAQAKNAFFLYRKCKPDVNPEAPNVEFTVPSTFVAGMNISF